LGARLGMLEDARFSLRSEGCSDLLILRRMPKSRIMQHDVQLTGPG
jgi:hypothetical protein